MKKSLQLWATLVGFAALSAAVSAQSAPPANGNDPRTSPQERKGPAETSLIGVSLYDTGLKIVTKFGTPDDITAISLGGGGGGAGGGGGGGAAGGNSSVGAPVNSRGGGGGGRGGAGTATPPPSLFNIPIDDGTPLPGFIGDPFGGETDRRQLPPPESASGASGGGAPPARGGGGGGAGGSAAPAAGGGGGGGGAADRVTVTRWTYNLGAKRYAFILDKFNRVVQIEAIGLPNRSVKTRRGVMLGCPFSQLIKLYGAPDGYEISGNTIVVRYLVYDRVAFRLQRLKADTPHQVTGIVVAAGKT